jgi:methionyl-tRNA formyltransferase
MRMRTVLIGQKWLACEVLSGLLKTGLTVAAVCPDTPGDRLAVMAREFGLPVVDMEDLPPAELALAAHCQRFIPGDVRARFDLGVLAYHPSLLPRHRGRDAVHWTLAMRDPIAGGTAYWMDEGADTGPIQGQDWCHVRPGDTPTTLWRRELGPLGVRLLVDSATALAQGVQPIRRPQDPAFATWEPALTRTTLASRARA